MTDLIQIKFKVPVCSTPPLWEFYSFLIKSGRLDEIRVP